jgi:hypothetical protein
MVMKLTSGSRRSLAVALIGSLMIGTIVPPAAAGGPRVHYQNDHGIVNYHQYVTPGSHHRSYHGDGHYRGHSYYAPRAHYAPRYHAYDGYYDYERDRRRKRRNDIAKGVAIGVGLAILGAALSHGGRRHR